MGQTVNWKPVIAAVHGYVLGVGFGLAMASDLIVAAEGTKFQIREVQRGIAGAQHWATTWFWGSGRFATEVALTGRYFSAEEAVQFGIVNRVVPQDQVVEEAERLAEEIMTNPPLSVRANVRVSRWFARRMEEECTYYTMQAPCPPRRPPTMTRACRVLHPLATVVCLVHLQAVYRSPYWRRFAAGRTGRPELALTPPQRRF
ncbi:Carnitinyl-CoA dehydratase [Candidatus Entotheonellaceae bacterium PAL068K]